MEDAFVHQTKVDDLLFGALLIPEALNAQIDAQHDDRHIANKAKM